jgi:hypothetical protein
MLEGLQVPYYETATRAYLHKLYVISHVVVIKQLADENYRTDKLAGRCLLPSVDDPSMVKSSGVHTQEVVVLAENHALLGYSQSQVFLIWSAQDTCFARR